MKVIVVATPVILNVEAEFEAAYQRDWEQVVRCALAATLDLDEAQDLAQDAYARLWTHRHEVDWSHPILPWLLVATRRLATDRFRRLRRILRGAQPEGVSDSRVRERWLDVQAAMKNLSDVERIALTLNGIVGYSNHEIAAIVGRTPGAVRAAINRARAKLEVGQ